MGRSWGKAWSVSERNWRHVREVATLSGCSKLRGLDHSQSLYLLTGLFIYLKGTHFWWWNQDSNPVIFVFLVEVSEWLSGWIYFVLYTWTYAFIILNLMLLAKPLGPQYTFLCCKMKKPKAKGLAQGHRRSQTQNKTRLKEKSWWRQ